MKTIIIVALLWGVFSFSNSAYAITVNHAFLDTGESLSLLDTIGGQKGFTKGEVDSIVNLKNHTVIVKQREYQTDGTITYYRAAGIAIDKRHILTVNHIVYSEMKSDNYYFSAEGVTPYTATIVKTDPAHDLALLEIGMNAPDLIAEPLSFANNITEGEPIYTIGHPNNYYELTEGTADVKSNGWNDIEGIALNATIQEGNSGGIVINPQGEIVGMVFCAAKMIKSVGYMVNSDDMQIFLK